MKSKTFYISWALQLLCALILLQTLFFKFTAAPESVYIFEKVGLGTAGRIGTGVVEMIAALLLLVPSLVWLGAGLGMGIMTGAIFSHLTLLGIEVQGDGGYLFFLGLVVFVGCGIVLYLHRQQIPIIGSKLN